MKKVIEIKRISNNVHKTKIRAQKSFLPKCVAEISWVLKIIITTKDIWSGFWIVSWSVFVMKHYLKSCKEYSNMEMEIQDQVL